MFLIQLCLSQSLNASASKSPSVQRTFIIETVVTDLQVTRQKNFSKAKLITSIGFNRLYEYSILIIDNQNPLGLRLFNWFPQSPEGLQRIYRFVNCFITSIGLKIGLDKRYTVVR